MVLLMVLALATAHHAQAQVVINEVMAQNSNTLAEPDFGESADWVELYNSGAEDVDLSGWYITDKLSSPTKYALPQGTLIAAGGCAPFRWMALALAMAFMENGTKHIDTMPLFRGWEMARVGI